MAHGIFKQARQIPLSWDWERDTFRATLVNVDAHPLSLTGDRFIADISPAARVQTIEIIGRRQEGKNYYSDGLVFDVPASVPAASVEIVIWHDTGDEYTSQLIGAIGHSDDDGAIGFPLYTNGGRIHYVLPDGAPLMC
jgi:hypothetical protein